MKLFGPKEHIIALLKTMIVRLLISILELSNDARRVLLERFEMIIASYVHVKR